jgi:hypothetical protein
MQPIIHWNEKPDLEANNIQVYLVYCGLHFLFHRAQSSLFLVNHLYYGREVVGVHKIENYAILLGR